MCQRNGDGLGFLKKVISERLCDDVKQQSQQTLGVGVPGREEAGVKIGLSLVCLEAHGKVTAAGGARDRCWNKLALELEPGGRSHGTLWVRVGSVD